MNVLAGMTSGAVASAIANPTDVLKVIELHVHIPIMLVNFESCASAPPVQVRMQSASDVAYSRRKSCAKFFRQIYREEGLHGLYRVRRGGGGGGGEGSESYMCPVQNLERGSREVNISSAPSHTPEGIYLLRYAIIHSLLPNTKSWRIRCTCVKFLCM